MSAFWEPFRQQVEEKSQVSRDEVVQARELGIDPKSGRPISVRMGRYGAFAQIGTRDDEEKPRFAGLRQEQRMDKITLEEALALFQLPRTLGETPEGETVSTNIGRFGPYVRYGKSYVSLKEDDPYTVTLEKALELIAEHKTAAANKIIRAFDGSPIQVLRGRYGPYITDGERNARIPKNAEPEKLTLAECEALIQAAPPKKKRRTATRKKAS